MIYKIKYVYFRCIISIIVKEITETDWKSKSKEII